MAQRNELVKSHMNSIEDKSCEFREKEMSSQTGMSGNSHRKGAV